MRADALAQGSTCAARRRGEVRAALLCPPSESDLFCDARLDGLAPFNYGVSKSSGGGSAYEYRYTPLSTAYHDVSTLQRVSAKLLSTPGNARWSSNAGLAEVD